MILTPSPSPFDIWTIYHNAEEVPARYLARRWVGSTRTDTVIVTGNLEDVRDRLRAAGLHNMGRHDIDDVEIVEVWL